MARYNVDGVANQSCYSISNRMEIVISAIGKWIFQDPDHISNLQKSNPLAGVYIMIDNRRHGRPDDSHEGILFRFLPHLLMTIIIFVVISRILRFFLRYLKQPLIVCQLLTGVMIFAFLPKQNFLLSPNFFRVEMVFGLFGVLVNLFVVAIKFDFSRIWEFGRKKPLIIGISSQLITILVGLIVYGFLHKLSKSFGGKNGKFMFYVMLPLTSTYQCTMMDILDEYGLLNSELGRLALSSTMMQFITQYIFFITLLVVNHSMLFVLETMLSITVLVAFIFIVIRPYSLSVVHPHNDRVRNVHLIIIMLIVVFIAMVGDIVGFIYLAGPFIVGLMMPTGPPLGTSLIKQLNLVATELLFPIVLMAEGYYIDWPELKMKQNLVLGVLLLVILSFLAKIVACISAAMYCKMTLKEGLILGLMMNFRGLIHVLYYTTLVNQGLIDRAVFTAVVLATITISIICVPLVVILYKPLRTRNTIGCRTVQSVCSSHENYELHVMACFYDEKPIPAILDFLESLSPIETSHNSISIYPIYIVELKGRAESDLIWHCDKTDYISPEQTEYNIHNHFITFEQSKKRGVTIIPFTSLTPLKTMHQDVCSLILEREIAFVIVPLPKKNSLTALEDDAAMHNLVPLVIQQASCSVGIMVHDGKTRKMISGCCEYHIGVIFFGGPDDREAIAIASNLARHPNIYLSILCFKIAAAGKIGQNQQLNDNDDKEILDDDKVISELQAANVANNRATINEIVVENMEQAYFIMKAFGNKHDLVICGRKQQHVVGSDLENWMETPELGVIGDILASDESCMANLLIVQQHKS